MAQPLGDLLVGTTGSELGQHGGLEARQVEAGGRIAGRIIRPVLEARRPGGAAARSARHRGRDGSAASLLRRHVAGHHGVGTGAHRSSTGAGLCRRHQHDDAEPRAAARRAHGGRASPSSRR